MNTLTVKHTALFDKTIEANKKFIVHQGGTRSSKSYSVLQYLIFYVALCSEEAPCIISLVRKSFPSLKLSLMRDFFKILSDNDLYEEKKHNKTDNTYVLNGHLFEFLSMDTPEKKRGSKRDYLFIDEANELIWEEFFQLMIRTSKKIILGYNPSMEYHWIYDRVIPREDCIFIQSTYKDNPFLEDSLVSEIERLKDVDDNYWKIYGLGEKGVTKSLIFDKYELIDEMPETFDEKLYGSDFGYNNPSTLIEIRVKDKNNIYIDEKLYKQFLTNTDLILNFQDIIPEYGRDSVLIKADSAEPDRIEEIKRAGFWIEGAKKGPNSVKDSIDSVKRKKIFITKRSINVIKEIRAYKWKETKDGRVLDEPVPFNDHAMAGLRYAVSYLDDRNEGGAEFLDWDTRPNRR